MAQARALRPSGAEAADESDGVDGFAAGQWGEGPPSWRPRLATGLLAVAALGASAWLGHRGGLFGAPVRSSARADVDGVAMADEEAAAGEQHTFKHILRAQASKRKLALKEKEWSEAEEQMHKNAIAEADKLLDELYRMRTGGGAEVEQITVMTDGASEQQEPGLTDGASEQQEPGCSEVNEDCSKTQCCTAEGHQCYEQDQNWATCMPACSKKSGKWSCAELGERTPLDSPGSCSVPGESCLLTRCCTEPGMQCYLQDENAYWGSCAYDCKPGAGFAENWTSCEELGERAPDPLGCSWSGEACSWNQLCCHEGQRCVRKNGVEAYCTHLNASELGEDWSGEVLGGSRLEYAVTPVPPEEARGTSLYCFMAVLPGSSEEELKDLAAEKGASIFACDASTVFWSRPADFTAEGTWTSVMNTDSFKSIWEDVKQNGQYQSHDWTVKVDPDSVFFPDRLKEHLQKLNAPKEMPIYIKNVAMKFGFFGAIEVLSKEAVDKLFWDGMLEKCEQEVGTHSGEDGYIKGCLDMIGAGFMEDIDVLRNPSADGSAEGCVDPARVCFHAFKDIEAWEVCYNQASLPSSSAPSIPAAVLPDSGVDMLTG